MVVLFFLITPCFSQLQCLSPDHKGALDLSQILNTDLMYAD